MLADPGAGGQRLDAALLDRGLEGEVEIAQRLAHGQAGEPQRGLDAPQLALGGLGGEQPIEEAVRRQILLDRLLQELGQPLGGVPQADLLELGTGRVEVDLRFGPGGHRATSVSAA